MPKNVKSSQINSLNFAKLFDSERGGINERRMYVTGSEKERESKSMRECVREKVCD